MSEEQPPTPLRLRPRNRDAAAAPATPTIPVVVPIEHGSGISAEPGVASVADPAPGRFRLKPKITLGAADPAISSEPPASTPVHSAEAETVVIPRLKLKVATATLSDPIVESMPDASPAPPACVGPTDGAVITADSQIGQLPATHEQSALVLIPSITAPADSPVTPIIGAVSSPVTPIVAPPVVVVNLVKPNALKCAPPRLILGVLALLLLVGGSAAYFYLMQEEPPPPTPLVRRSVVPLVPKPFSATPGVVPPAPTPESVGIDQLPPAPGPQKAEAVVAAKPNKAPVVPVMTPAFRLWLEGVRINGVTASASTVPRVIINGRLVRPGDTIDSAEGIVFESVDTEKKCVMFRNRSGFVASKPY